MPVMRNRFLGEMLENLLAKSVNPFSTKRNADIITLCHSLLAEHGDIPALKLASAILEKYRTFNDEHKSGFFQSLIDGFSVDSEVVTARADAYARDPSAENYRMLQTACEAPSQELLRRLNRVPGGTLGLVHMRADLLKRITADEKLARLDVDFKHLFSSWFNRGFLVMRAIDWNTPANTLEKIIAYEAVHEITNWDDLRARLQPEDRRCFAFFHPAIADEPLVFVEVALLESSPATITEILNPAERQKAGQKTTAAFYSISNCQKGLQGISFGNLLIKQVSAQLQQDLPQLKNFVTLSPVPGFAKWLESEGLIDFAEDMVPAYAAHYLAMAKRGDGKPLDPVARFHLANGAILDRVNAGANPSTRGMAESLGIMVNYRYDLDAADTNHEKYFHTGEVTMSKPVRVLASKISRE